MDLYEVGFVHKDQVFSILNQHHKDQAIALFHVFYYAKDWTTFYKTAAWARYHVNVGMFIYSLTVAVTHRTDLSGLVLPAPYEICPYYFFNNEVIQKAKQYQMQGYFGMEKVEGTPTVSIPANYTGWFLHTNTEQKISYFTEDIGLNAYYYYFHIDYPYWMTGQEYGLNKDRRGELHLYEHQQLLARYYLERLSNGLGHIPEISYTAPIQTGYTPYMQYPNGKSFASRHNDYNINVQENYKEIQELEDFEHRLRDLIDNGFVYLPDGKTVVDLKKPSSIDVIGNLVQSNPDSLNSKYYGYFEIIAKIILGASATPYGKFKVVPSVLEHFETALRDPVFYQLYKRVVNYYYQFNDHLEPYSYEELLFPGVTIEGAKITKLVTYFDKYDADITNVLNVKPEPVQGKYKPYIPVDYKVDPVIIKAQTTRLNHKEFQYTLTVNAVQAKKSTVRVFLGPKYDEYGNLYTFNENRQNFVQLDIFPYDLTTGKNAITRSSAIFTGYVNDRTTFADIYKHVLTSIKGETKFLLDTTEAHCGFPNRLMLPKGTKGGMTFQFFFVVTPFYEPITTQFKGFDPIISCGIGSGAKYVDRLPFGYPLDREIDETHFFVPNVYAEDAIIFYQPRDDVLTY